MGSCASGVRQIGSAELATRLSEAGDESNAFPLAGSMDLVDRCNLRCCHCYISEGRRRSGGELSTAEVVGVLGKLADAGVLALLLTGGEPLLRDDFRDIYMRAKRTGFLVTLFTNATLVDDSLADFLAEWPPRRIEATLYGATPGTYESVTCVPGSFARFEAGVMALRDRGLLVRVKYLVMKDNAAELEQAKRWTRDRQLPFRYDALITPGLDGDPSPLAHRIPPGDAAQFAVRGAGGLDVVRSRREQAEATPPALTLFTCGAGIKTFHVDTSGHIHPCALWRASGYDLLAGTMKGWRQHIARLRRTAMRPGSKCAACRDRLVCPVCPALSLAETGRAGAETDYYCAQCAAQAP